MIEFYLKYKTELYNKIKPLKIKEGLISHPYYLRWYFENTKYEFISNYENFIIDVYTSQEFLIVCYSEDSKIYPHPNNLVVYNLKKEVIKIIEPLKPINEFYKELPFTSLNDKEYINQQYQETIINGEKYISVGISKNDMDFGYAEFRYLNLRTFEFHPTYYDILKTRGDRGPMSYEKYGR